MSVTYASNATMSNKSDFRAKTAQKKVARMRSGTKIRAGFKQSVTNNAFVIASNMIDATTSR